MSLTTSSKYTYYAMRNIFDNNKSPLFAMTDREQSESFLHNVIASYPMYAVYANKNSVKDLIFDKCIVMLKSPTTKQNSDNFINGLR